MGSEPDGGAAIHPVTPSGGKGLAPGTGGPVLDPSSSPQSPAFRFLLPAGDRLQAETQPQIKASSLDRPPGKLLTLPPEQKGGLLTATGGLVPQKPLSKPPRGGRRLPPARPD